RGRRLCPCTTLFRAADDESYARCCEALAQHDVRARLAEIAVPTLAIWGEYDTVSPEPLAAEIAERVQHGRTRRIADAGHLAPAEDRKSTSELQSRAN